MLIWMKSFWNIFKPHYLGHNKGTISPLENIYPESPEGVFSNLGTLRFHLYQQEYVRLREMSHFAQLVVSELLVQSPGCCIEVSVTPGMNFFMSFPDHPHSMTPTSMGLGAPCVIPDMARIISDYFCSHNCLELKENLKIPSSKTFADEAAEVKSSLVKCPESHS